MVSTITGEHLLCITPCPRGWDGTHLYPQRGPHGLEGLGVLFVWLFVYSLTSLWSSGGSVGISWEALVACWGLCLQGRTQCLVSSKRKKDWANSDGHTLASWRKPFFFFFFSGAVQFPILSTARGVCNAISSKLCYSLTRHHGTVHLGSCPPFKDPVLLPSSSLTQCACSMNEPCLHLRNSLQLNWAFHVDAWWTGQQRRAPKSETEEGKWK